MRPLPGDDLCRSRSTSFTEITPLVAPRHGQQMTYFLSDERGQEIPLSQSSSSSPSRPPRSRDYTRKSNYGIEILEATIQSTGQESDELDSPLLRARKDWKKSMEKKYSHDGLPEATLLPSSKSSAAVSRDVSPFAARQNQMSAISHAATPLYLESPLLGSTPDSSMSRRNSETDFSIDESASQVLVSSADDGDDNTPFRNDSTDSQLVMPSLNLPTRRPFTEKGKSLGRLKMLIAGDSGVGKTSLIKAIVQSCEDIVHVDPLTSSSLLSLRTKSSLKSTNEKYRCSKATSRITEVYASTRAYPQWWSELDEAKILRRRKSTGEPILERNICFVDTPGYTIGSSSIDIITPVIQYLETQFEKSSTLEDISSGELISMLSGSGGTQVDVAFYVILDELKPIDLDYMRRLSALTNLIPIIAHADKLSRERIDSIKENVRKELRDAKISIFDFRWMTDSNSQHSVALPPFAVSTMTTHDDEMDASLLMSSHYVEPLIATELGALVSQVFEKDNILFLRHSAVKKCVEWRQQLSSAAQRRDLQASLNLSNSYSFLGNSSNILTTATGSASSYALARIHDHTQREEQLAKIRLSKWASDLQRSLQNERSRFEALAKGEQAVWLTEKMEECVRDGTLLAITDGNGTGGSAEIGALVKRGTYSRHVWSGPQFDRQDPLGLLQFNEDMKHRGITALRIVGSFGIIGGLAYWISKNWHTQSQESRWMMDWGILWTDW